MPPEEDPMIAETPVAIALWVAYPEVDDSVHSVVVPVSTVTVIVLATGEGKAGREAELSKAGDWYARGGPLETSCAFPA